MAEIFKPENAEQVGEAVKWALGEEAPLEILGAGSKQGIGRPPQVAHRLDLSGLSGVSSYEPEELVLTAQAGTPLAQIEALLTENNQAFAFEPPDFGPLFGGVPDRQTIGGVLACNLAGPRRVKAGGARDHFLGVHAISGRGEVFKSGGQVVKNVTGYDLCKLFAGSYGTLAVMTDVSVKVLPAPEKIRTVLIMGLDDAAAAGVMSEALQSPHEVSAAAHLPQPIAARSAVSYVRDAGAGVTALRVEGFEPSAVHRCDALKGMFAGKGTIEELHGHNSTALWREVRDVAAFVETSDTVLWRVSVPPMAGPALVADIAATSEVSAYYDWGGGLVWLSLPAAGGDGEAERVRGLVARSGGHATLWRAPAGMRAAAPVFQPLAPALAALTGRVKESFDPKGLFNPGRMYPGV